MRAPDLKSKQSENNNSIPYESDVMWRTLKNLNTVLIALLIAGILDAFAADYMLAHGNASIMFKYRSGTKCRLTRHMDETNIGSYHPKY